MVSTKARSPIFWPLRRFWACGDWLMLSWPPATTIFASPRRDLLGGERDGPKPRAAELVDAPGRALDRDAGVDRRLTGGSLAGAGLQHLAEDHLVDVAKLDAGASTADWMAILPSS